MAHADGEAVPEPTGDVVIRWLTAHERTAAGEVWCALEQRLASEALSCSWLWTQTWLTSYGDRVPHRFAVGEVDGEPCGVVLVTRGVGRRRGPFTVRTVHLGTAGEPPGESVYVEHNRVLVESSRRRAFAASLMSELRRDADWHELHLDGFVPEDAAALLAANPSMHRCSAVSPTTSLQVGGDVLATLRSGTRRKVRRSLEVLGEVDVEWATTPEQAQDVLSELIVLHQKRWAAAGEPGAFASPRFVSFHRELVARLLPTSRVVLFRVRSRDGTVGCLYHLVEGRRVLFYQSGLSRSEDSRVAPGFLVFALCMQACADRGYTDYDFLAGDSRYKRDLSNGAGELVWATTRRPALRWELADRAGKLRTRVRDTCHRASA